jgi:release factor glutamine methyltransferase
VGALVGAITEQFAQSPALRADGVDDPRREATWLVADLLGQPRSWPRLAPERPLAASQIAALTAGAARRARGEPLAYVTGRAGFRTLELRVDSRVLIPRPETEQLVELALARLPEGGTAVDVGTGSGAIALALAVEGRPARVVGTDLSLDALAVARENGQQLSAQLVTPVEWRAGASLAPLNDLRGQVDLLVSNPPYISADAMERLPASVRSWEPPTALVSGRDGLGVARELIAGAPALLRGGGWLMLELDSVHLSEAMRLACDGPVYDSVAVVRDQFGRDRFLVARLRATSS